MLASDDYTDEEWTALLSRLDDELSAEEEQWKHVLPYMLSPCCLGTFAPKRSKEGFRCYNCEEILTLEEVIEFNTGKGEPTPKPLKVPMIAFFTQPGRCSNCRGCGHVQPSHFPARKYILCGHCRGTGFRPSAL